MSNKKYYNLVYCNSNTSDILNYVSIKKSDLIKNVLSDVLSVPTDNTGDSYIANEYISGRHNDPVFYPIGKIDNVTKEVTFY